MKEKIKKKIKEIVIKRNIYISIIVGLILVTIFTLSPARSGMNRDCLLQFNPSKEVITAYDNKKDWYSKLLSEKEENQAEILNTFDYIIMISPFMKESRCQEVNSFQTELNIRVLIMFLLFGSILVVLMTVEKKEE